MDIVEALKKCSGLRVSVVDRWLVWDSRNKVWVVREYNRRSRKTVVLIDTESQEEAVAELIKGE